MGQSLLPRSFFLSPHVLEVARGLLGKVLYCEVNGILTGGLIVETEAYCGQGDKGSHAYNGRRTTRNEVMYHDGGIAYVYICYGIHTLFNVVTNQKNKADAVLIRAVEPLIGEETMRKRRKMDPSKPRFWLTAGPGRVSEALGIHKSMSGLPLQRKKVWIEHHDAIPTHKVVQTMRIGLGSAEEAAYYPWRFYVKGNAFVSCALTPTLRKRTAKAMPKM